MIAPSPVAETPVAATPAAPGLQRPLPYTRARFVAGELALTLLFIEGWSAMGRAASWPALVLYTGLMAAAAALFIANPYRAVAYRLLYVTAFGAVAFAANLLAGTLAQPDAGVWALYLLYFMPASFPVLLFPLRTALIMEVALWSLFAANIMVMSQWKAAPAGALIAVASLSIGFLSVVALTHVSRLAHEKAGGAAGERDRGLPGVDGGEEGAGARQHETTGPAEEMAAVRERNRMAQDIHDTLGHHLTVLNVQLEAAIRLFGTDQERSFQQVLKAKESAAAALRDVRTAVSTLQPQQFEQGSLRVALERMVANFSGGTGLPVDLAISGLVRQLPSAEETVLYRAVQEALTNIQKHARATRGSVTLRYHPDTTDLTIADNGAGSADPTGGMGLTGIRARVANVGGTVSIRTKPGAGLILHLSLPAAMPSDTQASAAGLAVTGAQEEYPT